MSKPAVILELEAEQLKSDVPDFRIGDTIRVHLRIVEGNKERVQMFQGTVIARKGSGLSETVTLHRVAYGRGMERIFIINSPKIAKIEVLRRGKVRRAKLNYLKGSSGKKAKVKELITSKSFGKKATKKASPSLDENALVLEEETVEDSTSVEKKSE